MQHQKISPKAFRKNIYIQGQAIQWNKKLLNFGYGYT